MTFWTANLDDFVWSRKFESIESYANGLLKETGQADRPTDLTVSRLIPGTERDLAALDRRVFKEPNQFGDDMITLARELPDCVHILYGKDSRKKLKVRGYMDMFFFEPNTFVSDESLIPKVERGELPTAHDILNHPALLRPGADLKNRVVDLYIDALCVERGQGRGGWTHVLVREVMERMKDPSLFGGTRLNRIATIAVSNNKEDYIDLPYANQLVKMDRASRYAMMGLMQPRRHTAHPSGLDRHYFVGEFEKSPMHLAKHMALTASRRLRHLLAVAELSEVAKLFRGLF